MMEDPFDVDVGEGEQLPAPQSSGPPPVLIVFPLQGTVPFPGLILPVLARAGAEEDILVKAPRRPRPWDGRPLPRAATSVCFSPRIQGHPGRNLPLFKRE